MMAKDILLFLIRAMQIEFLLLLIFFAFGFRKLSRFWQIRISVGLITLTAVTLAIFAYVAYSNGMVRK